MEQSDAERQLVELLRGLDLFDFRLQISISEKHSDPLMVGAEDGICWRTRLGP